MKTVDGWKSCVFIGSLLAIAFVVNSFINPDRPQRKNYPRIASETEPPRTPPVTSGSSPQATLRVQPVVSPQLPPEPRQAPQSIFGFTEPQPLRQSLPPEPEDTPVKQAARHAEEVARNVNTPKRPKTSGMTVAIATANNNAELNPAVTSALINHLRRGGITLLPSYFKPEFVSSGKFDTLFNGSNDAVRTLDLDQSLDGAVLAREEVNYTTSPALENLITASMKLRVSVVRLAPEFESKSWSFSANGAGFREADARAQAEERIIKTLTNDGTLTLSSLVSRTE